MQQLIFKITAIIGGLCLLYLFGLYFLQKFFILFPDKSYISPREAGVPLFREIYFTAGDSSQIMAWYAKGDDDKPALLFFHGNAGQIATFAMQMAPFLAAGYSVFMPEYRGFASTKGSFSQQNVYSDALAAYDFLHQQLGHNDIVAYGYSMGTAAAAPVAAERPVCGLVLMAPFYSLKKLVGEKPVPAATLVLADEMPSYLFIERYKSPLLIVHGAEDKLIPPHHGRDLYQACPARDKKLKILEGQSHNALFFENKGRKAVLDWLSGYRANSL